MSRRSLIVVAVAGFVVGLLASSAYATSHRTPWVTIFGNSSACALGQGSINDTTHKSGAATVNRRGCNAYNAPLGAPGGWLTASTQIYRHSQGYFCSYLQVGINPSSSPQSSSISVTSSLVPSAYCPTTAAYMGLSSHTRKKLAGGEAQITLYTGIYTFY